MDKVVFILLWLMVFTIPWEGLMPVGGFVSIIRVIGYLASVLALSSLAARGSIRRLHIAFLPAGLYVAWRFMSILWAENSLHALLISFTSLSLFVFFWMIWEFAGSVQRQTALLHAYVLGCGLSLTVLYSLYFGIGGTLAPPNERYTATTETSKMGQNVMGLILAAAIPIAAYLASRASLKGKSLRRIYWAGIPVAAVGVCLTGSRAATLAMVIGIGLTFLMHYPGGKKAKAMLFVCVLCAAALVPVATPARVLTRLSHGTRAITFQTRLELWSKGLSAWTERPLHGFGTGSFLAEISSRGGPAKVAHNTYVGVLFDLGLVGFGFCTVFVMLLIRGIWSMPNTGRGLWFTVLAVWAIGAMSGSYEYTKLAWFLFAMILAQSVALRSAGSFRAAALDDSQRLARRCPPYLSRQGEAFRQSRRYRYQRQ